MIDISVIIPVYNAEKYLEKSVQSALQFKEVKEVLLIEDKSTDHSLKVCQKLTQLDNRIKLFQHPDKGNHGAGATRNLGLIKATQDFIAFLDADDYYLPNRFDKEKTLFNDKKIEGVFGAIGVDFLSQKGKEEFQNKFQSNITTVNYPAEGKDVFLGLLDLKPKKFGAFFHLNALTIRKKSVEKFNLKFNPNLRVHQDSDFIIKLAYHCYLKTGNITEPIAIRGVHDDNRITKIKRYTSPFYKNLGLLYDSIYQWAHQQENLDKSVKEEIKLKYLAFKIANLKGIKKYITFFFSVLKNPKMLKTQYRFHALYSHPKT